MRSLIALTFVAACAVAVPQYWCGILRPDGSYIPGAILVWVENGNIAKRWCQSAGIPMIQMWQDATAKYDFAMRANQTTDALGHFYTVTASIKLVQPYITNYQCRQWFADTTVGFTSIVHGLAVGTVSMAQANDYIIKIYPKFQSACGLPQDYNNDNYYYLNYPYSQSCGY